MRKLLLLAFIVTISCKEKDEKPGFGCMYVTNSQGKEIYAGCFHKEMTTQGTQAGADKVADNLGIPRQSISVFLNASKKRFVEQNNCDCN